MLVKPRFVGCGTKVDVLVFGESPGVEESKQGLAFVGPSGKLIESILTALPIDQACLDNTVPEVLDGGRGKPTPEQVEQYAPYREAQIALHKPKIILTLGDYAMKALGVRGKVTVQNGKIKDYNGIPLVVAVHPAFILRNPNESYLYEDMISSLVALLAKGEPPYEDYTGRPTEWRRFLDLAAHRICSLDLETSTLDPSMGRVISAAISLDTKLVVITPTLEDWKALCDWYSKGVRIIHNAIFDTAWLRKGGALDALEVIDTQIMAHLYDETESVALENQIIKRLQKRPYWLGVDKSNIASLDIEQVKRCNALDAYYTYKLWNFYRGQDYYNLDLVSNSSKLAVLLSKMQYDRGLKCDVESAKVVAKNIQQEVDALYLELKITYPELNIDSPKQMRALLDSLGIKSPFKTKNRKKPLASVNKKALEILKDKAPVLGLISKIRSLENTLKKEIIPVAESDGYVHTSFMLCHAVTGRLSSRKPNLQNITRDSPVRNLYVSRFPGGKIIQADYSQQEFRIIMATAKAERALENLAKGNDPYLTTQEELGCSRQDAKALDLGLIYGKSEWGLMKEKGFSKAKARAFRTKWFQLYPEVAKYHAYIVSTAQEKGYVENMFGRRRHGLDVTQDHDRNQAYNYPGQAGGFDILAHALNRLEKDLTSAGLRCIIVHTVHDSIILDCPPDEVDRAIPITKTAMTDWPEWEVKLDVEITVKEHL